MAEFLSESWIAELDRFARDTPTLAALGAAQPLVVEHHVRGGRQGDVAYHFVFAADGARVHVGPAATAPDLVVVTDAATARGLHEGSINAQQAAMSGGLKIRGHIARLRAAGDALRSIDDAFHAVREATTYRGENGNREGRH